MEQDVHDFRLPRGIKHWAAEERPREKFISHGRESLSDAELLAILLGHGYRSVSAVDLARQLLARYNQDLSKVASCSLQELKQIKGIGAAKALSILAALEIGRRRNSMVHKQLFFKTAKSIVQAYHHLFADLPHEEFRILLLTRSNRLIAEKRISIGGPNNTTADPQKILKEMILHQASSVVLMHNHPSGNIDPSEADRTITRRIAYLAKALGAEVLDHIIFTNESFYSFADRGERCLTAS
jgi:DNA repair protein RadC